MTPSNRTLEVGSVQTDVTLSSELAILEQFPVSDDPFTIDVSVSVKT